MHTGTQSKYVIKPINRFDDGCLGREYGKRDLPDSIAHEYGRRALSDSIAQSRADEICR